MVSSALEQNFDVETGESYGGQELDIETMQTFIRKTKFNVPRSYLNNSSQCKPSQKCCLDSQETFTLTNKKKVIELKEVSSIALKTQHRKSKICFRFRKSFSATTRPVIGCSSFRRFSSFRESRRSSSWSPRLYFTCGAIARTRGTATPRSTTEVPCMR